MVWVKRVLIGLLAVPVLVGVVLAVLVGPYVLDDQRLDTAVMAVALDWRDFGLEKAKTRLQYELDARKIGMQVGDDDCTFEESPEGRTVRCAWKVDVVIPGIKRLIPMSFESVAWIRPDGDLQ